MEEIEIFIFIFTLNFGLIFLSSFCPPFFSSILATFHKTREQGNWDVRGIGVCKAILLTIKLPYPQGNLTVKLPYWIR